LEIGPHLANTLVGPIRNMRLSTDGVCIRLLTLLKSRVLHAKSLCFGAISVLPCRLVATALLARDCAAVVPFDRSGHHPAVLPWADGDTAWADADGDI
jgi:hypothetical protein